MQIIRGKDQYFTLIRDFEYIPFTQSEGWYEFHACMKPDRVIFLVDNLESPQIACFGHIKKCLGLRMLLIEGECINNKHTSADIIQQFYIGLKLLGFDIIEINSSGKYDSEFEKGIRRAGYLRPVGQFSIPLSIWINTADEVELERNWKRNIKKAINGHLIFEPIDSRDQSVAQDFTEIYNEMSGLKGFNHKLSVGQIENLLEDLRIKIFQIKNQKGQVLSMRILFLHGDIATDVFAANTLLARDSGATHFMMERIFQFLRQREIRIFDFGRVLYDTGGLNSVARFKNGAKGEHVIYNGEWSWYKRSFYRPMMYFVKRFIMKKREV